MRNNFKLILTKARLNYRRELIIILAINLALIALMLSSYFLTKNELFFIPFIFLMVLVNGISFYRYLFLYSKNLTIQIREFVYLFRYLYLDINNQIKVEVALKNLKVRASLKLNEQLENLLTSIHHDQSLLPYLTFAHFFSSVLVEEVMVMLYRYSQSESKEDLREFNEAYFKLKRVIELDEEKNSKRQYDFIKTTALIGTAIIVMVVIISAILIMEEYIHG